MRTIRIVVDTPMFQAEAKRSGNAAVPPINPWEMATLPHGVTILTGNKSREFGGGPSGTGYVMQAGKATHSVGISQSDVRSGQLRLP